MKKFALRFALIVSAIPMGFADQTPPVNEAALKEELVKLEKQSWEAWKNRDGKFFQDFLSDDHVEVGFGGVSNKAEIVSFVGSPVCTGKRYQLNQFELKMLDKNTALITDREVQDTVCHN